MYTEHHLSTTRMDIFARMELTLVRSMHVNAIEIDYKRALLEANLGRSFFTPSSNNFIPNKEYLHNNYRIIYNQ
jgi:hypothetical protein